MAEIIFDPISHTYTVDDQRLDSVTTILKEEGFIDDTWYQKSGTDRGSAVHEATAAIDRGDLTAADFEGTEIYPYLEAWELFKIDTGFIPEIIEQPMVNTTLMYAGTLDRFGTWNDDTKIIIDIKSGAHELWHGLQLAAYSAFPDLKGVENRRVVRLKKTGKYAVDYKDKAIGHYDHKSWDEVWRVLVLSRLYKKRYCKV